MIGTESAPGQSLSYDGGKPALLFGNGGAGVFHITPDDENLNALLEMFTQLYREQAHYLERTAPWIERVGLNHVKQALFDDPATVSQLAAKFRFSQQFMQDDPWARRAAGEDRELHQHLAEVRPLEFAQ